MSILQVGIITTTAPWNPLELHLEAAGEGARGGDEGGESGGQVSAACGQEGVAEPDRGAIFGNFLPASLMPVAYYKFDEKTAEELDEKV